MNFDWRELLAFARHISELTGVGFSLEASQRSAVSRAYYSAFCHAREYASARLGYTPSRTASDHTTLRNHLRLNGLSDIADQLARLRVLRNRCDYDNQVVNLSLLVNEAIETAEAIVQALPR